MANPAGPPLSPYRELDQLVITSGQVGIDPATGEAPADFEGQARVALDNLEAVLADAGASLATVLKATIFLVDRADFPVMNRLYLERFGAPFPARSTVICGLADERLLFEIEAIAAKLPA